MNIKTIFKTLMWRDLLPLSMAVYFGTVLQRFLESLISNLIIPLIIMLIPKELYKKYLKTTEFDTDLRDFSLKLLTLLVSILILYYVIKSIIKIV